MRYLIAIICLPMAVLLSGCSVGMAPSDEEDPDMSMLPLGAIGEPVIYEPVIYLYDELFPLDRSMGSPGRSGYR